MYNANKPAFPNGEDDGMTYREWLIGQAISGPYNNTDTPYETAKHAIAVVDAVIDKHRQLSNRRRSGS